MKNRCIQLVFAVGILVFCPTSRAEAGIIASCGPLKVHWNVELEGPANLEYWSFETKDWEPLIENIGKTGAVVDRFAVDGRAWLPKSTYYRVHSCDVSQCDEGSALAWIPAYACSQERHAGYVDELLVPIPIRRPDGSVRETSVNPQFTQRSKIVSYNLMMSARARGEWKNTWLPMRTPPHVNDENATVLDWIHFNVWYAHEVARTGTRPDATGTGREEHLKPLKESKFYSENPRITYPKPGDW